MKWTRLAPAVSLVAVGCAIAWCESVSAQVPAITIEVDENCHGTYSPSNPLPCSVAQDPGLGGLATVTYDLIPIPVTVSPGDLLLVEPGAPIGTFSDVVRFNRPPPVGLPVEFDGEAIPTLVFYSDNSDGVDALADVGLPLLINPENNLRLTEVGAEGDNGLTYTPTTGQPGFVPGFVTTYIIHSDSVPEPATLALLGIGLAGLGFSRRRKSH